MLLSVLQASFLNLTTLNRENTKQKIQISINKLYKFHLNYIKLHLSSLSLTLATLKEIYKNVNKMTNFIVTILNTLEYSEIGTFLISAQKIIGSCNAVNLPVYTFKF